jgi:hypothetical protein
MKIEDCQKLSVRAKILPDVWQSNEPTFNAIKRELGVVKAKSTILIELGKMILLLKADLQEIQIVYLADYILRHYPSYTISDITCFTNALMSSKVAESWAKPTLLNIIKELDQYSIEKQEFAVNQRIKENSQHKGDPIQDDKFLKMYEKLKESSKIPVITQKQKDAEAIRLNNEKMEQMKKEGLI